jgi:Rieske Fe-S protein
MERRVFLRTTCSYCLAAGAGLLLGSLSSCSTTPYLETEVVDGKIDVPLSAFLGSEYQLLRPKNLLFDIALRKNSDGTFRALVLQCTHASSELNAAGEGYTCPLHGSTFDMEGNVTHGPAQQPLRELRTEQTQNTVVVHLS